MSAFDWIRNCETNTSRAIRKVEYADFGIQYKDEYIQFMADNIVCALVAVDRDNGEQKTTDEYYDLRNGMIDGYFEQNSRLRNSPSYSDLNDVQWSILYFPAYFSVVATDLLTDNPNYKHLSDAILRCCQTVNVRWGGTYSMTYSSKTYDENQKRELNQSLMNIAIYNRKAKGVSFYRPQISRKNIRRVSIGASILVVSLIFWKVWGNK